jgi:hypothetical protein
MCSRSPSAARKIAACSSAVNGLRSAALTDTPSRAWRHCAARIPTALPAAASDAAPSATSAPCSAPCLRRVPEGIARSTTRETVAFNKFLTGCSRSNETDALIDLLFALRYCCCRRRRQS